MKFLYLARIGRQQTCRAVRKWTKACDKRLARLISYIHHTSEYRQYFLRETQHSFADLYCSKTLILQET